MQNSSNRFVGAYVRARAKRVRQRRACMGAPFLYVRAEMADCRRAGLLRACEQVVRVSSRVVAAERMDGV